MPLTAAQIVTLACQEAKCPGFTAQAGQYLNATLQDLCMNYDLDAALGSNPFSFNSVTGNGSGPYTLPNDYLRTQVKDGKDEIFYTINGVPYPLIQVTKAEYDWLVQTPGFQSYPYNYATDLSQIPAQLFVWPPASGSYAVTHRYYKLMPDIVTPETSATVPWFKNTQILQRSVAGRLMGITGDSRQAEYLGDNAERFPLGAGTLLNAYLKNVEDREGAVHTVGKDRRRWGRPFDQLKNTKNIGWCLAAAMLVLSAFPVHAQSTKAQLNAEFVTQYPDNTTGLITPQVLRTVSSDIVNSIMPTAPVVASNTACFDGTTGLLKDCGVAPNPVLLTGQIIVGVTGLGPVATDATTWFDNVWCSTVGMGIFKSTGVWKCDRSVPIPITLFGAVADSGTTDNGPLIRAAYDYAAANGLAVKIPRSNGWFGVSTCRNNAVFDGTSLTVANGNKSVSIYGDGWSEKPFATPTGSWILPTGSFPSTCSYIRLSGSDKVAGTVYDGFGIGEFGGSLGTPKGLHGIFFDASNPAYYQQEMKINNIYIGNTAAGYSIKCTALSGATAGCIPDSSITNSKFMSFNADFLADHVTIAHNTIGQNTTVDARNVGIEFTNCDGCTSTAIIGNNISNFNGMVVINGANKPIIRDNEMELGSANTRGAMIDLVGATESATITGNQLAQNSLVGDYFPIRIALATGAQVYDNRLALAKVTPYDYISITGSSLGTFVGYNRCSYNLGATNDLACPLSSLAPFGFQYTPFGFSLPGTGSGRATISTQGAAGAAALLLPTTSGTLASSASSPLALNATTGALTCSTCATTGGANIPSVATGDILYGSAANVLSALPDVATGNALISGGVNTAPAWGKIGLATHVSGTLQATNAPAFTGGDVTSSAGSLALLIGATKVTSAMLNSDVFSTAHTWAGQQTFVAPILGTPASGVGTNITGVNAATLGGATFASPGAIGTGAPSTGAFVTLAASTSVTSPLHIGGSGTTGTQMSLKTTTSAGTTDAFAFNGGNNGATNFGLWDTTALVTSANFGAGGAMTGTQTGVQITAAVQPMLVTRATGGTATKQMARFIYDPASSLSNPGFLFQSLTDAGAFSTNDNVFWGAGGGISVGNTTYPGVGGMQISGQLFMPSITTSSAAQTGTVCWTTGTGKFTVDTTVGCLTSIMAAKNITERLAPAKALDIVTRLDPFAFRYKKGYGDSGRYEQFGFGAEEVAKVDERLAGRDPKGALQGVRYQEMTAVLAGAIKQLKADNENLRADIRALKSRARK